ncbi:sensor histidine kinase [Bacillus alkalicola]|uniref:histidine kinase n=2 Tax=Bacillaceae TaxID=186817 RepID=A0ABS6JQN6_9BACI|nr:sensor histidine kinase [Bacillus alkalicola]MBU9720592.1 sensor histidine kinase [Bacillus alkalicola]
MVIVLLIVGVNTYNWVSAVLKDNAEKQIQQTAIQASGKMEALYEQLESLMTQISTNANIQHILLHDVKGNPPSFQQRQSLMYLVNSYLAYYNNVDNIEIYRADHKRLFPLHEGELSHRIDEQWIQQAEEVKGRTVWVGTDPADPNYFIAIKQITLMERWFSHGGYLLVRMKDNYFEFEDTNQEEEYMILFDSSEEPVTSNYIGDTSKFLTNENHIHIDDQEYMMVSHMSEKTGWKTIILTPVQAVTRDLPVLKTAIIISGALGFVIYLLFSIFFSTMITRPILKLTKTMRYGKLGSLKAHSETSSTYEINELNNTYNQMVETMNSLIQEVYEKELNKSRSELKALQAQINPHFLYNTLDALYWSLEAKGEEKLADYVLDMSDLFRYTISHPKEDDWVELKEEINHIERYLKIMRVRFGSRLIWRLSVSSEHYHVKLPKLLIQPLVENAILHGVGNKTGPGCVEIIIKPSTNHSSRLRVEVKDNGVGMTKDTVEKIMNSFDMEESSFDTNGTGMAIVNCNRRLNLYYNESSIRGITIHSSLGEGTTVSFEIPFKGGDQ